jgi:hypothetical protein
LEDEVVVEGLDSPKSPMTLDFGPRDGGLALL